MPGLVRAARRFRQGLLLLSVAGLAFLPGAAGAPAAEAATGFATAERAAGAATEPAPSAPATGKAVCTITDEALDAITGLAADDDGYLVVEGDSVSTRIRVYHLGADCGVVDTDVRSRDPLAIEDMAVASDGTIWLADIGDEEKQRTTVALWKLAPGKSTASRHRFAYPDGPHDAKALLLDAAGKPIILTKDGATTGIYHATTMPEAEVFQGAPLTKVGDLKLTKTDTPNPFSVVGTTMVTGAAKAADGSKVLIRTYSDAYEYDVAGGDVIKALTTGKPRRTPLPEEPNGEAIAYSADGASLLTVSKRVEGGAEPAILSYQPAAPVVSATLPPGLQKPGSRSWFDRMSAQDFYNIMSGVGLLGFVLAATGFIAIRRSRARWELEHADDEDEDEYGYDDGYGYQAEAWDDGYDDRDGVYALPAQGGGQYGHPPGRAASGTTYRGTTYRAGGAEQPARPASPSSHPPGPTPRRRPAGQEPWGAGERQDDGHGPDGPGRPSRQRPPAPEPEWRDGYGGTGGYQDDGGYNNDGRGDPYYR